jgi:DNA-directed RNA polymerase beta' subunit
MLDPAASYRLHPVAASDVRGRSRGPISKNPIAYDLFLWKERGRKVLRTERGGFHCERLFGAPKQPDPEAFAHIELAAPLAHPFLDGELDALPVLPAFFRPARVADEGIHEHELTFLYNAFYQVYQRWARLRELQAPDDVLAGERASVERHLAVLFDNAFAPEPVVWSDGGRPRALASLLDGEDAARTEAALFALGVALVPVRR